MKKQEGICCCCNNPITRNDIAGNKVHVHHMLPRSKDGTDELNNLRLLHQDCHILTHQVLSRDEMAYWMKRRLDYTLKSNIAGFQSSQGNTVAHALFGWKWKLYVGKLTRTVWRGLNGGDIIRLPYRRVYKRGVGNILGHIHKFMNLIHILANVTGTYGV